ncbi:hypothetical protein FA15DRAFT_86913 [Coprinopsis marcescibilis]|uniref:Uncharacterized protein n=1 Tax=Coprinopsis marcescibilis TaxID=230819 RepID=A0A5C3LHU8_COPMA|nr:hypothetical protein FA15DRAFT_86913 [Coprinopsis marcescibilis]
MPQRPSYPERPSENQLDQRPPMKAMMFGRPQYTDKLDYRLIRDIVTNQPVEVKIAGYGWVVGIALTCMQFFQAISRTGYMVSYKLPGKPEPCEGYFHEPDIRPRQQL